MLRRRRRALKIIGLTVAAFLVMILIAAAAIYTKLNGNITTAGDINSLHHRPSASGGAAINVLILGSQTRNGQTGHFTGTTGTDISDTSMLVHVTADHRHATVVSIPRDTLVDRPACRSRDGSHTIPAAPHSMIDLAMNVGGPLCSAATVEKLTQIRIDHFVRLDFNGFRKLITDIGGVDVCVPPPGIHENQNSGLNIDQGIHNVTGDQALAFVRDRHGIGDGGDRGRIEMQKMFVSSLITKLQSQGNLNDPVQLYHLADTATSSLTVDEGLGSISKLLDLTKQVKNIPTHNVTFVTMPNEPALSDPNRLVPAPDANLLWQSLRSDKSFDAPTANAPTTPATPSPQVPAGTKVSVFNGTTTPSLASKAASELQTKGISAAIGGTRLGAHPVTQILYPTGHQATATALAALYPGAQLTPSPGNAAILTVVLGQDYAAHSTSSTATTPTTQVPVPSAIPNLQARAADQNICTGLPKSNG